MSLISKLHFRRRRSKLLINSMLVAGIFPYDLTRFDIRKYAWTVISFCCFVYLVVFTLYNLTVLRGFMVVVSIIKTAISAGMCLIILLITFKKRRALMYLIDATENNFYTYSDEQNFKFVSSTSNFWEKIIIYATALYFIGIYGVAVLSNPIYSAFNPDLLRSGGGKQTLTFTWVPFKADTISSFYMAHTTLFLMACPVVLGMIGNLSLTLNIQMEFRYQFERLTYALRTTAQRVQIQINKKNLHTLRVLPTTAARYKEHFENADVLPFTDEFNEKYEQKLVECVKHYQKIVDVYKKFHGWFGLTYSIVLAHSVLTLAMMSYSALLNIKNFGVSVKYLCIFLIYLGQVYIHCHCGEKIFRLNENLSYEIYNLEWYKQPASRRKLHYIFLCETQKPLRLYGFLIYPASLTIFTSIMKLSYSYLNLLRTYGSSTSSYRVIR